MTRALQTYAITKQKRKRKLNMVTRTIATHIHTLNIVHTLFHRHIELSLNFQFQFPCLAMSEAFHKDREQIQYSVACTVLQVYEITSYAEHSYDGHLLFVNQATMSPFQIDRFFPNSMSLSLHYCKLTGEFNKVSDWAS